MTGQKISITSPQNISAEIDSLERTFKALLGREVTLSVGAQESSLAIQYESGAQLDAIVSLLIAPNEAQSLFERSGSSAENDESLISTSEPNRRNQSVIGGTTQRGAALVPISPGDWSAGSKTIAQMEAKKSPAGAGPVA